MGDSIRDHLNRQPFRLTDCFIASLAVTHHARQFHHLGYPAPIHFAVQLNGQLHPFIISAQNSSFDSRFRSTSFRSRQATRSFFSLNSGNWSVACFVPGCEELP